MKLVLFLILLAGMVLFAGCTSSTPQVATPTTPSATPQVTPATTPAAQAMPNLVGNWTGTSRGYANISGYQFVDEVIGMNVVEQNGNLFKGQLTFPVNGTLRTKEFAGVLGPDGKTIKDVEYPGGFTDGVVISPDELELIFRDQANPSTITIDSLKRSTATTKAAAPSVQPVPDLLGKWNGTSTGYVRTSGYQVIHDVLGINVTEQKDRLFKGQVTFIRDKTPMTKDFAGVVARDGKTLKLVESPDGFSDGVLLSADEIELIFRDNADPSQVVIDSLRRSAATNLSAAPAVPVMPGIVGNWSGISKGYMESASGYLGITGVMSMNVAEQNGRLFKGQVAYVLNGTTVTKDFAGVFGRDGKTIETIEYPGGFCDGTIVSADEIQLVFRDTSDPSTISIDTFKRSK